jgi:RNA polymerase sigma-70 factor (family 1)
MKSKAFTDPSADQVSRQVMEVKKEEIKEFEVVGFQDDEFFIRTTLLENHKLGTELLYNRYYQPLCTHAIKFVGSREIAEDIVSDIFYQFYSKKIFERVTTSYRAYLFRTVRNQGYNHLKWEATKKIPMEDSFDLVSNESQQPDHITQYEELYQDLEKIINDLPLQRRNIYLQANFEGKSLKEIATELNISIRTVEVQIYRARRTIRSLIKNKWFISLLMMLSFS